MKDCYGVHLIRWFDSLPEKDQRRSWLRLWHKWRNIPYPTKKSFLAENIDNLNRNLIDNKSAWTKKDLGYED